MRKLLSILATIFFASAFVTPANAALGDEWALNSRYSSRGLLALNDGSTEFVIEPGSTSSSYGRPDIDQVRIKSDQCWHYRSPSVSAWTYPQMGPLTLRLSDRNLVFEVETLSIDPWTLNWVCRFNTSGTGF